MNFSLWSSSDYAAWGAVVATLALAWNIVRTWRSGPRIYLNTKPDMALLPETPATRNKIYIAVTAVNRGNATTTITNLHGYHSTAFWDHNKKQRQNFVIPTYEDFGNRIPYVLKPGEDWHYLIDQSAMQEKFGSGYLSIAVTHNQRNRPVYARRVRINAQQD